MLDAPELTDRSVIYIGNLRARWVDIVKVYVLPFSGSVQWLNDDVVVGNWHGVVVLVDHGPWLWVVLLVGASSRIPSKVQGDPC